MKFSAKGMDINYSVEGEGPWLTLSHSLACNLHMWDEEARRLSKRYKVLRYDTRGHGGSSAPAGAYTLEALADDLHGLLQGLGVQSTHFVGLSMGGMIGQTCALKYPGMFKSLALCDTTSSYPADAAGVWAERIATVEAKGTEPIVETTLARWFTEPFRKAHPEVVEKVAEMIRTTPAPGFVGCSHGIFEDRSDCALEGNPLPRFGHRGRARSRHAGVHGRGNPPGHTGLTAGDHCFGRAPVESGAAGRIQPGAGCVCRPGQQLESERSWAI